MLGVSWDNFSRSERVKPGAATIRDIPFLLMSRTVNSTPLGHSFASRLATTAPETSRTAKVDPGYARLLIPGGARKGRPPHVKPSTKSPPTATADFGF